MTPEELARGLAAPGEVVLEREAAERFGRERVQWLGPRSVAGLDEPVEIFTLSSPMRRP